MSQPTLDTRRMRLVPLSDEHLAYEVELDSHPDVMRYLGNGRARARDDVETSHLRRLAAAGRKPEFGYWVGFLHAEFVGWWLLLPPERPDQGPVDGQAELGYRILPRWWRKGLASEGARELLRYGFENLALRRIFAETMAVNAASRATMTSIGLRYIRTFQDWEEPIPSGELGEVEYAISRDQWSARRARRAWGEALGNERHRRTAP